MIERLVGSPCWPRKGGCACLHGFPNRFGFPPGLAMPHLPQGQNGPRPRDATEGRPKVWDSPRGVLSRRKERIKKCPVIDSLEHQQKKEKQHIQFSKEKHTQAACAIKSQTHQWAAIFTRFLGQASIPATKVSPARVWSPAIRRFRAPGSHQSLPA